MGFGLNGKKNQKTKKPRMHFLLPLSGYLLYHKGFVLQGPEDTSEIFYYLLPRDKEQKSSRMFSGAMERLT